MAAVIESALPLRSIAAAHSNRDYDPLLAAIGDARFVLLGEATHGTQEFYQARSAITQRLVAEKGFSIVLVEGEWPAAYRLNKWISDVSDDASSPDESLMARQPWAVRCGCARPSRWSQVGTPCNVPPAEEEPPPAATVANAAVGTRLSRVRAVLRDNSNHAIHLVIEQRDSDMTTVRTEAACDAVSAVLIDK